MLGVLALLVLGTSGFCYTEGWGPWQAFYLTLVTLTTVGYEDFGLSIPGQRVSALLMLGGIATLSYCLSHIIQYATHKATNPEARMIKIASKMSDHFIVCGMGRTGDRVARKLAAEGLEFVVIDQDTERIDELRRDGIVAIKGGAADDTSLLVAGVERARGIAAVTSSDATNAMICLTVRSMNPDIHIAARAERESSVARIKQAGANVVINPIRYGGDGIVESLVRPDVSCLLYSGDDENQSTLRFIEVAVTDTMAREHRTIRAILPAEPSIACVAVKLPDSQFELRPDEQHELIPGEILVFAGSVSAINAFRPRVNCPLAA